MPESLPEKGSDPLPANRDQPLRRGLGGRVSGGLTPFRTGQPTTKPANSRLKLALAGVLTVVFLLVLVVQFGGETDGGRAVPSASAAPSPGPTSGKDASRAAPDAGAKAAAGVPAPAPWPTPSLDEVLRHNPFAAPAAVRAGPDAAAAKRAEESQRELAAKRRAEQDQALAKLQKEGVTAVLGSEVRGNAALVGSQAVRAGDDLNGFRVIAVETDGVVLQRPPVDSPP